MIIPIDVVMSDLRLTGFSYTGEPVAARSVQVSWGAENQGSGSAKFNWFDRIYFSTNAIWDAADLPVVSDYQAMALAPGSNYTRTATFTIPEVPEGRYWLVLRVDQADSINETNETNNELIIPIDVVMSDLRPTGFSYTGEPVAARSVQVSWGAENQGSGSAKFNWFDRIYFSTNAIWDAADQLVVSDYQAMTLAPGSNYTRTATFTIPEVPEGRYWLVLRVDQADSINETNETNNELIIPIDVVVPDLVIADFRVLSGGVAEGSVRVAWTIMNQGTGTAKSSWYDRLYFSTNGVWEAGDAQLYSSYESRVVAPGGSYGRTNTVTLPTAPPGYSYLILRTDTSDAVFETAEANNTAVLALDQAALLPRLVIHWVAPKVEIYWPTSAVGFTLQGTPRLDTAAAWAAPTNPVVTSGTNFLVSLDSGESSRFFRLLKE